MLLLLLFIYINFVFILALSPRKSRIAEADHGFVKTAGPANSREFTGLWNNHAKIRKNSK